MTPFERNIEVWRQLWRVIERSDIIVQIVDARNPLLFRSEDLENYVKAVDAKKENLLLINKADMMSMKQRKAWGKYLREAGIAYKFFSAQLAKELNEAREDEEYSSDEEPAFSSRQAEKSKAESDDEEETAAEEQGESSGNQEVEDEDTQILTVEELEEIFLRYAPSDRGKS